MRQVRSQLKVRLPSQLNVRFPSQLKVRVEVEVLAMGGSLASGGARQDVGALVWLPHRSASTPGGVQGHQVLRQRLPGSPAREPVDREAISRVQVRALPGKGTPEMLTSALPRFDLPQKVDVLGARVWL